MVLFIVSYCLSPLRFTAPTVVVVPTVARKLVALATAGAKSVCRLAAPPAARSGALSPLSSSAGQM